MENFSQILKNFFGGQGLTQQDVANKLHVSRTIVTNYINGQKTFGRTASLNWSKTFGIDALWLMTKGEQGIPPVSTPAIIATAVAKIDEEIINVPVLNLDVRGGLAYNNEIDVEQYTIDRMPFSRHIATEGDVVVPVYGDSMSPRYPSGAHILIRPLPLWREWLELGQSYVLELADYRRTIKIVRKGSAPDTYRLECYNVDYDTTEIAQKLIQHVWQVLAVVKRETM